MTSAPHASLWADTCDDWERRPPLSGDLSCDIAVVGGGLTGLWTAWYLAEADPSLRITVVERDTCGFGASGRNGGWCSALFPNEGPRFAAMVPAMRDTVDEVLAVAEAAGIDCGAAKGGTLTLATSPAHVERVRRIADGDGYRWLDADAAAARVAATGLLGAAFTPDCAAIHPARLVRGLARAVEARGVRIVEDTAAVALAPGRVVTARGTVRAEVVLRCTEGYTPTLEGHRRDLIPLYSLMIATDVINQATWDAVGLAQRETFTDGRHLLIYGQRTADGRLAFGGRGAPYHFGSRIHPSFDGDRGVWRELEVVMRRLFPQLGGVAVTHRWGGPLGVPRDWTASVCFDRVDGTGAAGGYVGDGVSTTNLAGRTLRDLVLGRDTELVRLPWVQHRSRRWEPEPLRFLGVNLGRSLAGWADRREARTGRPARVIEAAMHTLTG